jgi:hypothetical protein
MEALKMLNSDRRHTPREEPFRPLWRLHRQGHQASCDMVVRRCGFEARFLMDGRFFSSHTFSRPDEAMEWAGEREAQYRRQGWTAGI